MVHNTKRQKKTVRETAQDGGMVAFVGNWCPSLAVYLRSQSEPLEEVNKAHFSRKLQLQWYLFSWQTVSIIITQMLELSTIASLHIGKGIGNV